MTDNTDLTLAADVGGTNTRVALCHGSRVRTETIRKFRNAGMPDLGAVLKTYLAEFPDAHPDAVCAAVAGPVKGGIGRMTNLAWEIDGTELCRAIGAARGFVINDLEAQGHALDDVAARPVLQTRSAPPGPGERRLVVGIGTGFNAAPVHATSQGLEVAPSECGHISLPVWNELSYALSQRLVARHGFASVEEAVSGRGLEALCEFLDRRQGPGGPARTTTEIITALQSDDSGVEGAAVTLFCQCLGRVVGDLALIHLPWGGIYLIGGMARVLSPYFSASGFAEGFLDKGRFSDFLRDFDVFLVDDDFSALTGCARYAVNHRNS